MDAPAPTLATRPPRRRGRGRRGAAAGNGANVGNNNVAQNSSTQNHASPSAQSTYSESVTAISTPGGSGRKSRGARKNRRGRIGGVGGRESPADSRDGVERLSVEFSRNTREMHPRSEVKLVVRRLPPRMSSDEFFELAGPHGADRAVWTSFYAGGVKPTAAVATAKRVGVLTRHSTAYIAFAEHSHATDFFRAFNGHRHVDSKSGVEYIARVERALFQTVPRTFYYAAKKPPAITGTIENDAHYQKFLARYKAEQDGVPYDGDDAEKNDVTHNSLLVRKSKTKGIGNGPAAAEIVTVSKVMEDVRNKRRERDERKTPKSVSSTRATRRRGRRAAASASSATASGNGTNVKRGTVKKNGDGNSVTREKQPKNVAGKGSRSSRAAKRAAAAAASAEASASGAAGVKASEEGDGVYVVRGPRARPPQSAPVAMSVTSDSVAVNAIALAAKNTASEPEAVSQPSPVRRKSKPPRAQAPPFPNPALANRPTIRLLKKETTTTQGIGVPAAQRGNGNGT